MRYKNILRKIDKVKYVSFDVFDTLLVRMTNSHKDIFSFLEKEYVANFNSSNANVYLDRIECERNARLLSKKNEITIDDIYLEMRKRYSIEVCDWLMKKEIEIEGKFLTLNPIIFPIYEYCKKNNKKIIIQSDMYLYEDTIKFFLKKNQIQFDHIFVSSNVNLTKKSGTLFKHTLKKLGLEKKDLVHIGDSRRSDYLMAKINGIKSILVPKLKIKGNHDFENLDNLIRKKTCLRENYYFNLGFEVMGPIYFTYSLWLMKKFSENNIKNVFFLSRDGKIMKECFDKINSSNEIRTYYLYVSRRSLIVPALYFTETYEEMLELTNIEVLENIDFEYFLRKLGLEVENCDDVMGNFGYQKQDCLNGSKIRNDSKLKDFFYKILPIIKKNSELELNELKRYLEKEKFEGKLAIVDIGWQGTMQQALNKIADKLNIDVDIYGYYFGVKNSNYNNSKLKMSGFAFDVENKKEIEDKIFSFGGLFEYFYTTDEGSVEKYSDCKPKLLKNEYLNTDFQEKLLNIQEGGLFYLQNIYKYYKFYNIEKSKEFALNKIIKFGSQPSNLTLKKFKGLYYSNINDFSLLAERGFFYYLTHPKKFMIDLNQSFWKVGFLKSIFKIKMPYYKAYSLIRKRGKKS